MKIIRWFLSHLFLILLIVAVIYGYMFWGNLAGENTPAGKAIAYLSDEFVEVEEFVNAVKAKQAQLSNEQEQSAQVQSTQVQSTDEDQTASSDAENTAVANRSIDQQPVSISYSHNQMRVKQNSAGEFESQTERLAQAKEPVLPISQGATARNDVPSPTAVVVAKPAEKFISPKIAQQLDNVDNHGKVINKSIQSNAIRESWVTARKSFYQRKYELSEKSYQDVIDNTTDNFDAYGELGNVYFNQGKKEKAAMAYYQAASILVRKGQIRRAQSLVGLLKHLDEDKANELQKMIDSAVS